MLKDRRKEAGEPSMNDKQEIIRTIASFVEKAPGNSIPEYGGMKIYDSPLVGFSSARDPLYDDLKRKDVIGPHHRIPRLRKETR